MINHLTDGIYISLALIVGGLVGFGFGKVQVMAQKRYAKKQGAGKFTSGIAAVPGAMQRTAAFIAVLALIQVGLPFLFDGKIQWIVSAGVVLGYGWTLVQQLRDRVAGKLS